MTQPQQPFGKDRKDFGLIDLKEVTDERGALCVIESDDTAIPFDIRRVFWIYGVPSEQTRGRHAHRTCSEFLIPVHGSFTAHVTDGKRSEDFVMNSPHQGLYIPPMVWCSFSDFTPDCVCLCLASHPYDTAGYINDLRQFKHESCQ